MPSKPNAACSGACTLISRFCAIPVVLATFVMLLAAGSGETWVVGPFLRPRDTQPIILPNKNSVFNDPLRHVPVHWEALHTFNPAAIVRNGKIYLLYRAEDDTGRMMIGGHTSRIGLAESDDGIHFKRNLEPVLYPADDDQKDREVRGGCEDPRVVQAGDGTYVMTYTQWNRKTYDAAVATSKDLRSWTKHGPAFAKALGGKYRDLQYKSPGIVTKLADGRLVATRIGGKYWMYWGSGNNIYLATSVDLINWDPMEDAQGRLVSALAERPGHFDSGLVEVGPPPVLTDQGILLVYNGMNSAQGGDKNLSALMDFGGQALFSARDPSQVLGRTNQPFFKPQMSYEKSDQYAAGTTFVEGLAYFKEKWFLYYGCADSAVGVAVAEARSAMPH